MPTAIALGLGLAAVFVAIIMFTGTTGVVALVSIVMGLAAVEFYGRVTERGYRPATIPGIVACALLPVATYWRGETAIAVVLFLALVATVITSISAEGIESGPLPNTAITMLGIGWIGVMGSFAGLILAKGEDIGTDTIFALAIGVVANDVGALFVGSAAGRTPLRAWISPNKTVEGLVGGTVATLGALALLSIANGQASTWIQLADLLVLGLIVAILAPIGDLTESMFKRNLDVKDFGTVLPGHGGVLDRFDGFLFVLPGAYYVLTWLEPWVVAATA
jgi:phosphatidate cytidylyltransferase